MPYFGLSTTLVIIFVKKFKKLYKNTDNNQENCDPIITQLTIKFTLLATIQYTVTTITIFVYALTIVVLRAAHGNIFWITMYYTDVIVNMICLYLQYEIGNNDYNKYCKYCVRCLQK